MSDSTHTQGPFSHGFNLLANFESRDGLRTPVLLLEDEYNRARACWNACDGIDTDALEVTPDINDLYDGVVNERNALRAEVERLSSADGQATRDVLAERQRQIDVEGWTTEHDDEHARGALAGAAGCYAIVAGLCQGWSKDDYKGVSPPSSVEDSHNEESISFWPWNISDWKPKDPRSDLVRAGALILAEIERLDRAALKGGA